MRSLDPLNFAPSAWIHDSPWKELEDAVAFGKAWEVLEHEQMKLKMLQDQCNKKFAK